MEEKNKVSVKIYGQEYTIAGNTQKERILKVADYVDTKMHEISKVLPAGSVSSLAVLTAVNAADEYFGCLERINSLNAQNEQLKKDSEHYVQLWDESKKSYLQYKEDAKTHLEQKEEMQKLFNEKTVEMDRLSHDYKQLQEKYDNLLAKNVALRGELDSYQAERKTDSSTLQELENRCKDMESSFFDLQMENIKLKGDLERYKK